MRAQTPCRGGEMVDTPALGAGLARGGGSSPLPGTNTKLSALRRLFCLCRERTVWSVRVRGLEEVEYIARSLRARYETCTGPVRTKTPLIREGKSEPNVLSPLFLFVFLR